MSPSTRRALELLRSVDGAWVSGNRIADVAGYRFGARLEELRRLEGITIERRRDPTGGPVSWYRIPVEDEQLTLGVAS